VRDALVGLVELLPFLFEALAQLVDLLLGEAVLVLRQVVLQVLDHSVLVVDVGFYVLQVVGGAPVVFL
jgi:hypothetical protein